MRSSIAVSLRLSSALPPRSVTRVEAISSMISATVVAFDSVSPVQVIRVPLSELVTMTEETFLGTCLLLISSGTTDGCIEFIFLQGIEQGSGLQFVAGSIITRFFLHSSLVDAFLHAAHDEFGSEFLRQFITILDGFLEVMSCVDVQQREWNLCRIESFVGKICNHDRILATRKEDDWTLELGSYFAEYVGTAISSLGQYHMGSKKTTIQGVKNIPYIWYKAAKRMVCMMDKDVFPIYNKV